MFNISANVSYRGKPLGSVVISFETFLRKDMIYPKQLKHGLLIITNVKLLNRKHAEKQTKNKSSIYKLENEPDGNLDSPTQNQKRLEKPIKNTLVQNKAIIKNQQLATKMTESFNNHFVGRDNYDDLFIKPNNQFITEGFMNDTDNSLIPSIIELSSYEQSSETESSYN